MVVRDTESDGDISDWDPIEATSYIDDGSAIFSVVPSIVDIVRCEVWRGPVSSPTLPHAILDWNLTLSGNLQIEEPSGLVNLELGGFSGPVQIQVWGDVPGDPRRVQIVLTKVTT